MTREDRRRHNRELAAWCRAHRLMPAGEVWAAVKSGCRDVDALRALAGQPAAAPVVDSSSSAAPAVDRSSSSAAAPARAAGKMRAVGTVRDGDILPTGVVAGDPVTDPDTGRVWVTVRDAAGELVDHEYGPADELDVIRPRRAPAWVAAAAADYRDARDAWAAGRESSLPAPTSVPGVAGSSASMMQLTDDEYAAAFPRPRYADFVREHAARIRVPS